MHFYEIKKSKIKMQNKGTHRRFAAIPQF